MKSSATVDSDDVIAVEDLTKYYGQIVGIHQLSFTVKHGEIFGFLGPNGAGKTTTIRLLLDLLRPTSGRAHLFGQDIRRHSMAIRQKCGYLPGTFSVYGHLSGNEFLRLLANLRNSAAPMLALLFDRFQLSKSDLNHKIKHLSHGTRQKLGIVQAFMHQPPLLILDEPTIGLDPLMQEAFYELVQSSQKQGQTIFFSSHNLPEVEKICQRVAIIRRGELVALETLASLRKKRVRRLKFKLREAVADLRLPAAQLLKNHDLDYEFLVQGPFEDLLKKLATLPIEDLTFPEPDLEEIFMTFYRSDESE